MSRMVPNPQKKPCTKGMMMMSRRVITAMRVRIECTVISCCCDDDLLFLLFLSCDSVPVDDDED